MRAKHGDASGVRGAAWLWPAMSTIRWSKPIVVLLVAFARDARIELAGCRSIADLPSRGPTIVDLELSMSPGVFTQIVDFWGEQKRARDFWGVIDVRQSVRLDFIFPIAYAFLIESALSIALPAPAACRSPGGGAGAVGGRRGRLPREHPAVDDARARLAAGIACWSCAMSVAAIVKFALLAVASGFTIAALFTGDRGRVIRGARYSVLSLVIGTLPIIALDQGRDLLLGLADPTRTPTAVPHQVWFIVWTVVWALSVWYWSRILLDADGAEHPSKLYRDWSTWLPRVAGVLTLLVPGVACLIAARGARASHDRLLLLFCGVLRALDAGSCAYVILRRRIPLFAGTTAQGYARQGGVEAERRHRSCCRRSLSIGDVGLSHAMRSTPGIASARWRFSRSSPRTPCFFGGIAVFLTRARRWPIEVAAVACVAAFSFWNDNHDVRAHRSARG